MNISATRACSSPPPDRPGRRRPRSAAWPRPAPRAPNAVRYGNHARERAGPDGGCWPDGRVIRTRHARCASRPPATISPACSSAPKARSGIITEVTAAAARIPEAVSAAVAAFPTIRGRGTTLPRDPHHSVGRAGERGSKTASTTSRWTRSTGSPSSTMSSRQPCFFEIPRDRSAGVVEQAEQVEGDRKGVRRFGLPLGDAAGGTVAALAGPATTATTPALGAQGPGPRGGGACPTRCLRADLPGSPSASTETKKDIEESGVLAPIVGHVGATAISTWSMSSTRRTRREVARAGALHEADGDARPSRWAAPAPGRHGIGYGKMHFLEGGARRGGLGHGARSSSPSTPRT